MQPIVNLIATLTFEQGSQDIPQTGLPVQPKASSPLLPLVHLGPEHEILWNLDQDPLLLHDCIFEDQIFTTMGNAIKQRENFKSCESPEKLKDLLENFGITLSSWKKDQQPKGSQNYHEEIQTIEELFARNDICISRPLEKIQIEIVSEQQAYVIFLFCIYAGYMGEFDAAQRLLGVIKSYKNSRNLNFGNYPLIKKLSLLFVAKSNPKLALQIVETEIKKSSSPSADLLLTKGYILRCLNDELALLEHLNSLDPSVSSLRGYMLLKCHSNYSLGRWLEAREGGEALLSLHPEEPLGLEDLQVAKIVSHIYRFGGNSNHSDILSKRFIKTLATINQSRLVTKMNLIKYFPSIAFNLYLTDEMSKKSVLNFLPDPETRNLNLQVIISVIQVLIKSCNKVPIDESEIKKSSVFNQGDVFFAMFLMVPISDVKNRTILIERTIEAEPNHLDALFEQSLIDLRASAWSKSLTSVSLCTNRAIEPKAEWLLIQTMCCSNLGHHPKAIDLAFRYTKMKPEDPEGWHELGYNFVKMNDLEKGRFYNDKALSITDLKPEFRLSMLTRILEIDPTYPRIIEEVQLLMGAKKSIVIEGLYIKASWLLQNNRIDEVKPLMKLLSNKDARYSILLAQIAVKDNKLEHALEITRQFIRKEKNCFSVVKYRVNLLIKAELYEEFKAEFLRFISFKPTQEECVLTTEVCIKNLLEKNQINKAWELCARVFDLYPSDRTLAKLRNDLQTFTDNPLLLNLARITTPEDLDNKIETSKRVISASQENDDLCPSPMQPLVKLNSAGKYQWDFDQNEWDLDSSIWLKQLQNVYHKDIKLKNPTFIDITENVKHEIEELTNHLRVMVEIVIEQLTSFIDLDKSDVNVKPISNFPLLLDSLYLTGMFHELNQALSLATRPKSSKYFTPSDMIYINYVNFIMACKNKDVVILSKCLTYFEKLKLPEPNIFFEKIKVLIFISIPERHSNLDKPTVQSIEKIDKALILFKDKKNLTSLHLLKASLLASSRRIEECEAFLDDLDLSVKTKPEYLKIKCLTTFVSLSFSEVQAIGEAYFAAKANKVLEFPDLEIAFILSTVYRYKETKGNGDLYERLLKTLNDPKCWLFPNQNSYEIFLHLVFNFIANKACTDFDSKKIVLFDNEYILMQTAKETILYWWSQLQNTSFIKGSIALEDPRITNLVARVDQRIQKEVCLVPDVWYERALKFFDEKKYDKAMDNLDTLQNLTPVHLDALFLRAKIFFIREDFEKAAGYLRTCLNRDCRYHSDWTLLYSSCLLRLKKFDEFIEIIEIACREEPENNYLYMAHFDALMFVNRINEGLDAAQKILLRHLTPRDRLYILKKIVQRLNLKENVSSSDSISLSYLKQNVELINQEGDEETKRELYGLHSFVNLKCNEIEEAKVNVALYGKNDVTGLFLQASIEYAEKKYEEAFATVKKCLKILPKSYHFDLLFDFSLSTEVKALRLTILYHLDKHQIVVSDPLDWIVPSSREFVALTAFNYYVKSCSRLNRLEDSAKACDKLLKVYPNSDRLEKVKSVILQHIINKKLLEAKQVPPLSPTTIQEEEIDKNVERDCPVIEEKVEVKIAQITKPNFIYTPKPLFDNKKEREVSKYTVGGPFHPAFLKIQKNTRDEAQLIIDTMYKEDPSQLEVGLKMSEMMERLISLEIMEPQEAKPAPKPPKETPKPPAPKESALAPTAAPVIVPKDHLKSLNTALMSMSEIRKQLLLIEDTNAQVDPIYRNQAFASRLLSYRLFRLLELLKATKKTSSLPKFKANVENVFSDWGDVKLLRNLMALHGHRTSFGDLIIFCQRLVSGFTFENLECLTKGQASKYPPLKLEIEILFPRAFKYEWEGLEPERKKTVLLRIIDLELDFVAEMHEKYNPEVFFIKGTDVREVLKGSVLRIGKAFSRFEELGIVVKDSELTSIREASKRVRHQILDNSVMSEELQSKWLMKFMQSHTRIREKVNAEIPPQVARLIEKPPKKH